MDYTASQPPVAEPGIPSMPDGALLALLDAGGRQDRVRRLLQARDPDALRSPAAWRACGLDDAQQRALRHPDHARLERARQWLAQPGHRLLHWGDPDYPPLLRQISSPPAALWVDGDDSLLWRPAVALVGSRAASAGGCENAWDFACALAAAGLVVSSGLARGIDTAAHRGALATSRGMTVGVIGTGCDLAYPASHAGLQQCIAGTGAVVSEFWPGTTALAGHFPRRNRIIAGLSVAVLVVEAAERSGALITARLAAEAGREVLALPGSIHHPQARGCHRLLADGATLVTTPEALLQAVAGPLADHARHLRERLPAPINGGAGDAGMAQTPVSPSVATASRPPDPEPDAFEPDYKTLWSVLDFDPIPMDKLVERSGLTVAKVSAMLPLMELHGHVRVEHGRYSRRR